jgi:hypothetical protein
MVVTNSETKVAADAGTKNKPNGTIHMEKTLVVCVFVLALSACGPMPPKRAVNDDVVPRELVPPGYQQSECHFEKLRREDEPQDSGGLSSMGVGSAVANADQGGQTHVVHPPVICQHTVKDAVQICFDDDGVEHPMQWCLDRKAARDAGTPPPASSTPRPLCRNTDGSSRICGWEEPQ